MAVKPTYLKLQSTIARLFIWLVLLCFCAGLFLQFYITLSTYNHNRTLAGILVQLFSYFTILCNMLCAVSLGVILSKKSHNSFFKNNRVLTALTLYITIVGLVYNLILRALWSPQDWAMAADELLHSVNPSLYIIFWLALVPKQDISWGNVFKWLLWPFFYLVYILARGAVCGLYPYPFMDVTKLGYNRVLIHAFVLLLVFMAVGYLFILLSKLIVKIKNSGVRR